MKSTWPEVTLTLTTHSSSSRHQITVRCSQCISKYPSHVSIDRQTTYHYRTFGNRKYARRTGKFIFQAVVSDRVVLFSGDYAPQSSERPTSIPLRVCPPQPNLVQRRSCPAPPPLYSLICSHLNSVPSLFRACSVFPSRYAGKS